MTAFPGPYDVEIAGALAPALEGAPRSKAHPGRNAEGPPSGPAQSASPSGQAVSQDKPRLP